jgi:ribosomal protein S14
MRRCLAAQAAAPRCGRIAHFLGVNPLHPHARSGYHGALGEIVVAKVLAQLGHDWTVLHDVPVGSERRDIDHLIIGPAGIYTISEKSHSGKRIRMGGSTFVVNGQRLNCARDALREAARAGEILGLVSGRPVVVTPLIVVVNPAKLVVDVKSARVAVLPSNDLKRWLDRRPQVLTDREVVHFSLFADEASTWRTGPVPFADTERSVRKFEQLRSEVDAARKRARRWTLILGATAIVVLPYALVASFKIFESAVIAAGG